MITGNKSANVASSFSLVNVTNPDVLLWSVKPSEEGIANGLITRLWNLKKRRRTSIYQIIQAGIECMANNAY